MVLKQWWGAGRTAQGSRVQSRLRALAGLLLGLVLVWVITWVLLLMRSAGPSAHRANLRDAQQHIVRLASAEALESAAPVFPGLPGAHTLSLPDEWRRSRGEGAQGPVWYRFHLDGLAGASAAGTLLAVQIERACSTLQVQVNGQALYRAGQMEQPLARQCEQSHLVPLPVSLLQAGDNHLDVRIDGRALREVTARQRGGGLGGVSVGPWDLMVQQHEHQQFWSVTAAQIVGGVLAVLSVFALGLAWVRRLSYLAHFGLLTITWALLTARMWVTAIPLSNRASEILIASLFAPMAAFGVRFLLDYAGQGRQPHMLWRAQLPHINRLLVAQVLAMPISLWLAGPWLHALARAWYVLLACEVLVAVWLFLWVSGRSRRPEFWLMSGTLGATTALIAMELFFQTRMLQVWGWNVSYFVMPMLFAAVAFRLLQVYARALQAAEGARQHLEQRVRDITAEIEANFSQLAELRVEQVAERERKRIAGDLHDDLGAKLLTIVHTADNDRISSLAREALEEMRLSVRGLTGKAKRLPDALADWRAEVVQRLGQAGIAVEWNHPKGDVFDEPLSSRTYVQTTRILREAVSNIIKHSEASHVTVGCEVGPSHFDIVVHDNGVGIAAVTDGRLDRGHGMDSMKHRARQLNGQCEVESGAGFGTVIHLSLPLELESVVTARTAGVTLVTTGTVAASMTPPTTGLSRPDFPKPQY